MYIKLLRKPEGKNSSNSEPTILGRHPWCILGGIFPEDKKVFWILIWITSYFSDIILKPFLCVLLWQSKWVNRYTDAGNQVTQCGKGSRNGYSKTNMDLDAELEFELPVWTQVSRNLHTYFTALPTEPNSEAMAPRIVNTPSLSRFWLLTAHISTTMNHCSSEKFQV